MSARNLALCAVLFAAIFSQASYARVGLDMLDALFGGPKPISRPASDFHPDDRVLTRWRQRGRVRDVLTDGRILVDIEDAFGFPQHFYSASDIYRSVAEHDGIRVGDNVYDRGGQKHVVKAIYENGVVLIWIWSDFFNDWRKKFYKTSELTKSACARTLNP